jgi:hypothetical protein
MMGFKFNEYKEIGLDELVDLWQMSCPSISFGFFCDDLKHEGWVIL